MLKKPISIMLGFIRRRAARRGKRVGDAVHPAVRKQKAVQAAEKRRKELVGKLDNLEKKILDEMLRGVRNASSAAEAEKRTQEISLTNVLKKANDMRFGRK